MQQPPQPNLPKDPIQRAWVTIQRYGPVLLERVEARLRDAGLPPLEWYDVLWALDREGPQRQRDLANHMLVARYSVSRLIDKLEAEGLVERRECPTDARGQLVHITAAGLKLRKEIWSVYGKAITDVLAPLSEKEALQLATLLLKLA